LLVRYFVERSAVDAVDTTSSGNRSAMTLPGHCVGATNPDQLVCRAAEAIGASDFYRMQRGLLRQRAAGIINGLKAEASRETNIPLVSSRREPQLHAVLQNSSTVIS
jgi:hypothetical protein